MITAKGTGFLAVAILALLAGRLTLVGWLYLVDAVLWGIIFLSAVVPWLAVAFLDAHRSVDRPETATLRPGPSEGDQLLIEVALRNRAFFSRFLFTVFYDCPLAEPGSRLSRFFVAQLRGSAQLTLVSTVEAYQRGMHQLGPVVLESSAPFGLFRRRIQRSSAQPVLVYPQVHSLERLALVEGLSGTSAQPRKSLAGMEPVGSRHYFPGDPRRYIHWRNTARLGRPMVKEFEEARDPTLHLLFDATQVRGQGKETTLEYGIKVVASAADYVLRNLGSVRMWGGRLRGEVAGQAEGDRMTWPELLKSLALVEAGEGWRLPEALAQLPSGSSALVVVSADDGPAIRAIDQVAPTLDRLVVVGLEGFQETESDDNLLDSLEMEGISVIRCRPGRLPETLQSLERLRGPSLHQPILASTDFAPRTRAS